MTITIFAENRFFRKRHCLHRAIIYTDTVPKRDD